MLAGLNTNTSSKNKNASNSLVVTTTARSIDSPPETYIIAWMSHRAINLLYRVLAQLISIYICHLREWHYQRAAKLQVSNRGRISQWVQKKKPFTPIRLSRHLVNTVRARKLLESRLQQVLHRHRNKTAGTTGQVAAVRSYLLLQQPMKWWDGKRWHQQGKGQWQQWKKGLEIKY